MPFSAPFVLFVVVLLSGRCSSVSARRTRHMGLRMPLDPEEGTRAATTSAVVRIQLARRHLTTIDFAAMAHSINPHDMDHVGNFIDYPVVPHAYAPVLLAPGKFA